jgi:hypothetical protein
MVMGSVVRWLDDRMPSVQPFADLPPDDDAAATRAMVLADSACGAAPTLMAAARLVCTSAQPSRAVHALAEIGLCNGDIEQTPWAGLMPATRHLLSLHDWPPHGPSRTAFSALVMRSLYCTMGLLLFSPDQRPLMRISLVADMLSRRLRLHGGLRVGLGAFAFAASGHPHIARRLVVLAQKRLISSPGSDLRVNALYRENHCVVVLGLGDWEGLAPVIDETAQQFARLRCGRQEMNMRSLAAKLAFFQGRHVEAYRRFQEIDELALRRPGESWRAWGPIGLVEVGLCLPSVDDATLRRNYERAVLAMTEMENIDAAYTLRHLGLAARLAWRSGDVASALEAVHAGVAAARRMQSAWWAHEGYAGLGDTLLALCSHEPSSSGVQGPLENTWREFEPALAMHVRRFPPAASLLWRLQGARLMAQGHIDEGTALLKRAMAHAERQGMRVELAPACQALGGSAPGG